MAQGQNIENQPIASQYGVFRVPAQQLGSFNFNPASCQQSAGNRNFEAFSTGTPVKIVDSDPSKIEVVTPSSVYINNAQCVINVAPTYTHAPPFYLTSGTGGLQEALVNSTNISGANTIVLDALWHQLVGSSAASVIAAAKGNTTLGLVDVTTTPYTWYSWGGSAYAAVSVGGGTIPATALVLKGGGSTGLSVPAVPGTDYVIPSALTPLAPLASPALTGTPTAPTQGCGSNTDIATGAYVANCGTSLPSAPSIGAVPTATGGGTTYTGQIPLGGTTWYYPVEWFGAVGDATGAAGVGTDNTTAINNCLTAVATAGQGQCLLQAKKYRITGALNISASSVGIAGTSYGSFSTAQSNQLASHVPVSALVIDSASVTAINASGGAISTPISMNKFNDFTIIRTVADTGAGTVCKNGAGTSVGAAGLAIQYAGGFVIDHVWSQDSACLYYFQNAGAYGTGSMENSGGQWGANGFNPTVSVYGILLNGANSAESFRLRNSFIQTLYPGYSGVQSIGFLAAGPQLNDIMIDGFETAFVTYGEFFLSQGSPASYSSSDIHLNRVINDSFFQNGIVIDGLTDATGAQVEINGGWETTNAAGASANSAGVYILNSTGVVVANVGFGQNGSQANGVEATGSSHISIVGNRFFNQGSASIYMSSVSDASVSGNVFSGTSGNTQIMIDGISLTRSVISGNTLGGFASVGVSLDAESSFNSVLGVYAIDPANITTPTVNSGSNNNLVN